ncbi:phosphatidate phosphatase APP1 [Brevibacterium sanguinis]|uniref:Phosphatidate phosphatase APP1 n=2 Tax=Brevibacterium TaxID=1696 RepID=A0A366IFG3_9MICO|nr:MULTISPECIES: phosphatase domain-containing protein [Brevibacterium]RBP62426.1 phosphatidate phosphatase APP1 [Brevibacterium sanguinis]RBP68815.1 phosphatidate phosphatase APP1 [Brevibacterium celere]
MIGKKPDEGPLNLTPDMLHTAARMEDRFNGWIQRKALSHSYHRTVIAYDSYGGTGWVRVLARLILTPTGQPAADLAASIRGWKSFVNVPLPNDTAWVRVNDEEHMVTSDRGGIIDTVIPGDFEPGETEIEVWTDGSFVDSATVRIIGEDSTFGIISDIDDTIMVTSLPRPFLAAWNTFVISEHARSPVAGMAVLYDRLTYMRPNTPILYLSTGAWNAGLTLKRFLTRNLYPMGPLLLTDWGPTTTRVFRSGKEHKRNTLERLSRDFPWMKWLLVGDDGQNDEEIYSEFVENHPENVAAVAIRQLTVGEAVWAGGRSRRHGRGQGVPWIYAEDGAGFASRLTERGIISGI